MADAQKAESTPTNAATETYRCLACGSNNHEHRCTERKAPVEVEGLVERDNHHNAAKCPHCTDNGRFVMVEATELATLKQQLAESTPSPDTEGVRLADELTSAIRIGVEDDVTIPFDLSVRIHAFLRTAQNTGRDEEIERAWKQGFCKGEASNFGCFPPTVAQVDAEWRKSKAFIAVKSSPPVSTVDEEGGGS